MVSDSDIALVIEAQYAQLASPNRAVVNSESSFVAQRLRDAGHYQLATRYWNYVCRVGGLDFGDEVRSNEVKLKSIDNEYAMPAWGTYGT